MECKERKTYIDNISGVLIIFMIFLYHLPSFCDIEFTAFFLIFRNIFSFFMAWFFFKSGMFYRNDRSLKDEIRRCWNHLLLPFYLFNFLCVFIPYVLKGANHDSILLSLRVLVVQESIPWCASLWFLLSLSIVRIVYLILCRKCRVSRLFICLCSLAMAFFMNRYSYSLSSLAVVKNITPLTIPSWTGNVFLGLFFYSLGDILRDRQFNSKVLLYASFALYAAHLCFPSYLDFRINSVIQGKYLVSVIMNLSGIIVFNNLFFRFINTRIPLLTYIGNNSMVYYITHYTFFHILFVFLSYYKIDEINLYIITLIISVIFLIGMDYFFRCKKVRWVIGL